MKDSLRSSFFTTPRFHQKIHLPTWLTNASFGSHHIDHIGGAMCPSWKMMELVNGKDDIPYMENKSHVWNHQPDIDHIDHTWITEIDPIDPLSIHPIAARFSPISRGLLAFLGRHPVTTLKNGWRNWNFSVIEKPVWMISKDFLLGFSGFNVGIQRTSWEFRVKAPCPSCPYWP